MPEQISHKTIPDRQPDGADRHGAVTLTKTREKIPHVPSLPRHQEDRHENHH